MKKLAIYTKESTMTGISFVIPFDAESKAFLSRQETAQSWAKTKTRYTIDNEFVSGYEIVDIATRDRTSANHFQIKHPSGFEFQVSANTFYHLVKNYTIVKGIIDGEFCISGGASLYLNTRSEQAIEDLEKEELEKNRKIAAKEAAKKAKTKGYLKITDKTKIQVLTRKGTYGADEYLFVPKVIFDFHTKDGIKVTSIEENNAYFEIRSGYKLFNKLKVINSIIKIVDYLDDDKLHIHQYADYFSVDELRSNGFSSLPPFRRIHQNNTVTAVTKDTVTISVKCHWYN